LAIFYDDLGQTVPPPGLIRLGAVDADLALLAAAGPASGSPSSCLTAPVPNRSTTNLDKIHERRKSPCVVL
jgi:hypothetical protein